MRTAFVFAVACFAAAAAAQTVNPVYVDDSPVARETLLRVDEFQAVGNEGEAVRELQRLLDDQPDRLVPERGQNNLFYSVRNRVHRKLLSAPTLLERYRAAETTRAQKELDAGNPESVERARFLTLPGFEATLRIAQAHLEAAEFEAARATLEQLRLHPDRTAPAGAAANKDAAQMMGVVARYADRPDLWDLADRWAKEAGIEPTPRAPILAPPALRQPRSDFISAAPALEPDGVPLRPLWTSTIDPPDVTRDPSDASTEEHPQNLFVLPTVVGECIYVNDGTFISARDRFTLQPRWTLRPIANPDDEDGAARRAQSGRMARRLDDCSTVSILGRVLIATTGQNSSRSDAGRTYALDTATGTVLWSFMLPDLDPSLDNASVRGPAVIDGSTIILIARKGSSQRRMIGLYMVGVALDDGSLKWVRPIGSAGAIQFRGIDTRMEHAATLYRGIVYSVDRLGVMAGVEAATGRPLWIRRWPVVSSTNAAFGMMPEIQMPWQWDAPVIRDGSFIALTPDRSEVIALDRITGEILSRRPASELGSPSYLLATESKLAAVCGDSINFAPLADIAKGKVSTTRTFAAPGIRGRVMISGSRLLVPRSDGIAVIDPAAPDLDEAVMSLDRVGNVLPLQNQLLVITEQNLHSFVTWSIAQRILDDRMNANPTDPEPAITYAELAYRSQHPAQIVPAVDKAIASIERNPTSELCRQARSRLFDVIREMVDAGQTGWAPVAEAPKASVIQAPPRRRPVAPVVQTKSDVPILDPATLGPIIDRWGRIAQSPDERAVQLLALGRQREALSQPALAAESYQRILGDRQLASASWRRAGVSIRAEIEATRRTRQLVLDNGATAYAAFEAQAVHELEALGPGATPEDLERLARQYPAAAASATMWSRCAELHESAGRPHAAVSALREGLVAAEAARMAGVNIDSAIIGELGGRLAHRLQALDQVFAAAQLVSRLKTQLPDVALLDHGQAINTQALAAGLLERLTTLRRLPRIGPDLLPTTQPLAGWAIMQARSKEQTGRACEHIMLIAPGESKVSLWGIPGAASGEAARDSAPLQELWSRAYPANAPPTLYRVDPESVWLLWDRTPDGPSMERVSTLDGQTLWKTEPFRTLFPADEGLEQRIQGSRNLIDTPMDGTVKLTDVAITMDEQVVALVERSGRIACFEPTTGKLLWKGAAAVQQVHDADAGGGMIVIGGQAAALVAAPGAGGGGGVAMNNLLVVLDAREGRLIHRIDQVAGKVRWVRIAGAGAGKVPAEAARNTFIAGLDSEISCFDLENGKPNWTLPGGPAFESRDAWVFGDRLFILDENRSLWLASISTGRLVEHQLETYEHLVGNGPVLAFAMGPDFLQTAFTTDRGVCLFDEKGGLVGIDAIEGKEADEGALLHPQAARDAFIALETTPSEGPGNRTLYDIHLLDTKSAMLKATRRLSLELPPRRIALLDGKILVTAGTNTIVYAAPEVDR